MSDHIHNYDENLFPVFKFDLENRLIFANVHALPLMKFWNCRINEKLPADIISRHPEIFHSAMSHRPQQLSVKCNDYQIRFALVPFPEAGYIGMYGYCMELNGKIVPAMASATEPVKTVNIR